MPLFQANLINVIFFFQDQVSVLTKFTFISSSKPILVVQLQFDGLLFITPSVS